MHEEKGPRGWAIVGASFMLGFVIAARNSVGLTMPFRKEDPGWSCKFVATVGGAATTAIAAPAAGAFATMSLVSTTVAHRFRASLRLATSTAASGSTDGQLALMPLLAFPATAWRDAFIAPGVAALVVYLLVGREPPRPVSFPAPFPYVAHACEASRVLAPAGSSFAASRRPAPSRFALFPALSPADFRPRKARQPTARCRCSA